MRHVRKLSVATGLPLASLGSAVGPLAAGRSVQATDLGHLKIDGEDGLIGLPHPTRAGIGSYRWRASLGAAAPLPRVQ